MRIFVNLILARIIQEEENSIEKIPPLYFLHKTLWDIFSTDEWFKITRDDISGKMLPDGLMKHADQTSKQYC